MPLKKFRYSDVDSSRNDMIVVKHGWCRCIAKHPERTHVKLRDEAFLRRGKCGGQCKKLLILPCQ
jgi:hypothetical protein